MDTTYALTTGRALAGAAALIALVGVIAAGLALARGTRASVIGLVAGATGVVVGGIVVATADGGPGSGSGIVGGYAALALGVIAMLLSAAAHARHTTRRAAAVSGTQRE
ncbi:DUF6223 family protein [Cryptosporangium sp. NPDC048952]|uniref:DUF6223 family protein n=1 Tax=Cryptosporangium sp. NPDC048952 TaxID=3363961 RepID=UPI0037202E98